MRRGLEKCKEQEKVSAEQFSINFSLILLSFEILSLFRETHRVSLDLVAVYKL